jgi:transcriptional regulator with XRE-family HTH domain
MFLGDKIRELRLARGLSQETLARMALISTRTLVRIENRQHHPRPDTLRRIADALGVRPDFFELWTVDRQIRKRSRELVA